MMPQFSVVIPLYNKENEIARTLGSVLSQRVLPLEILVVDDGSTDGGAAVVREMAEAVEIARQATRTPQKAQKSQEASPLIRLISQRNGGVSAARNRGIAEARGNYISLLDADDYWEPGYLEEIARLIDLYPRCGLYCTGFYVARGGGIFPNETEQGEGIVSDYFRISMTRHLTHTSSVTLPKAILAPEGIFPQGMKLGEDQYVWAAVARDYPVCYSPLKLATFNLLAENRSVSTTPTTPTPPTTPAAPSPRRRYQIEQTDRSLRELYDPLRPDLNEYIARCGIGKAIFLSTQGYTAQARSDERFYGYTRSYRLGWWKLWLLNRLPAAWRTPALSAYKRLTWLISSKGKFEV